MQQKNVNKKTRGYHYTQINSLLSSSCSVLLAKNWECLNCFITQPCASQQSGCFHLIQVPQRWGESGLSLALEHNRQWRVRIHPPNWKTLGHRLTEMNTISLAMRKSFPPSGVLERTLRLRWRLRLFFQLTLVNIQEPRDLRQCLVSIYSFNKRMRRCVKNTILIKEKY